MRGELLQRLNIQELLQLEKSLETGLGRVIETKGEKIMKEINDLQTKVMEICNGQKHIFGDSNNLFNEEGQSSESVTNAFNSTGPPQDYNDSSDTSLKLGVFIISSSNQPFFSELEASNWSWLRRWFVAVLNKPNLLELGGSFRWVAISGIPILAWSVESITNIASKFGVVLLVHPDSTSGVALDRAFALVHSYSFSPACTSIDLLVLDRSYTTWPSVTSSTSIPVTSMPQSSTSSNSSPESLASESSGHASDSASSASELLRLDDGEPFGQSDPEAPLEDGEIDPLSPLQLSASICGVSEGSSRRLVASVLPIAVSNSATEAPIHAPGVSIGESEVLNSRTAASIQCGDASIEALEDAVS